MSLHVIGIAGSLRAGSFNRALLAAAVELAPAGMTVEIADLRPIPFFDGDVEAAGVPPAVADLKGRVRAAGALLVATPEYNYSVPGVLKNAIDHASRPSGQSAWTGKPAGMIGISPGALGTALAQQHLRNILASLDVPTLPQPEAFVHAKEGLFDPAGHFGPESAARLQKWMDRYVAWITLHAVSCITP